MAEIDFYMHIYGTKDAINVEELSSADIVERKRGKWMPIIDGNEYGDVFQSGCYCSECGEDLQCEPNFCPNCGADMRGGEDG